MLLRFVRMTAFPMCCMGLDLSFPGPPSRMKKGMIPMAKYVYLFSEGNGQMKELLGGKGANLAEMTNLGMPVPQGFTITTEIGRASCRERV